jgi:nucleoside-diphosphate-sugar epimerase
MARILVTGGTGFIGSALVRGLIRSGHQVRSLDNNLRGSAERLRDVARHVEFHEGDIRELDSVVRAVRGMDCVCHLAFINGTEFFYSMPELVLEVGVKGMLNVLDACKREGVGDLVLASSSEVYQTPPVVPTDETVPLCVPDPLNPRYSYGGGKIISELLTLNYGRKFFRRATIFRPHNVYGPDMGWEHVIPQLTLRVHELTQATAGTIRLPIQGSGQETRAFIFIDDFIDGLLRVIECGQHLQIYHIGRDQEVAVGELARRIAGVLGRDIELIPTQLSAGSTPRRCPDIRKLRALGFEPRVSLEEGLKKTVPWYVANAHKRPIRLSEGAGNESKAA